MIHFGGRNGESLPRRIEEMTDDRPLSLREPLSEKCSSITRAAACIVVGSVLPVTPKRRPLLR